VRAEEERARKLKDGAARSAWRIVSALEPTEVANALATSLAPLPNAALKAAMHPTTRMPTYCEKSAVEGAEWSVGGIFRRGFRRKARDWPKLENV
jgi:hypothetical protein